MVEYGAYNAVFGDEMIPQSKDPRCRLCDTFHKPNVNCGPTLETKLKTRDEIDKLVQNVSGLAKVLAKPSDKRTSEDEKMLEEFRQRLKTVETRLRAPSAKSHDGKSKAPSTRPPRTVSIGRSTGIAARTTRALAVLSTTRHRRAPERLSTRRMLIQARTGRLRHCAR